MDSGNLFVFYLLFHLISAQNSVTVFVFLLFCGVFFLYFQGLSIHNQWKITKTKQNVRHKTGPLPPIVEEMQV